MLFTWFTLVFLEPQLQERAKMKRQMFQSLFLRELYQPLICNEDRLHRVLHFESSFSRKVLKQAAWNSVFMDTVVASASYKKYNCALKTSTDQTISLSSYSSKIQSSSSL